MEASVFHLSASEGFESVEGVALEAFTIKVVVKFVGVVGVLGLASTRELVTQALVHILTRVNPREVCRVLVASMMKRSNSSIRRGL